MVGYGLPKSLLPCCVPYLQLQSFSINLHNLNIKQNKDIKLVHIHPSTFSLKSKPIVASECTGNLPAQNLNDKQVFPTPDSPRTIIL